MWIRKACVVGCAAVAILVAGAATAEDRWFVSGTVDSVNDESRTIDVDGHTLHLGVRARIQLAGGVVGTWADIVARDGEFVTALVRSGYRDSDEVLTVVLEDEIEDGEE